MGYARSTFPNSESYVRTVVGLDEDDIQIILEQLFSSFVKDEIPSGFRSTKIFQRLLPRWVIIMGPYKLSMMI